MTVEWFRNPRSGRRVAHALIDGAWGCSRAKKNSALGEAVPKSNTGHPLGRICAFCATEVDARAAIAREEQTREARGE